MHKKWQNIKKKQHEKEIGDKIIYVENWENCNTFVSWLLCMCCMCSVKYIVFISNIYDCNRTRYGNVSQYNQKN